MRADIVTARAAVAHAAWHGRTEVTRADIRAAARLALPHRRRRNPFDAPGWTRTCWTGCSVTTTSSRNPSPEPPTAEPRRPDAGRHDGPATPPRGWRAGRDAGTEAPDPTRPRGQPRRAAGRARAGERRAGRRAVPGPAADRPRHRRRARPAVAAGP